MSWFKKKKYVMIGEDTDTKERIAKLERLVGFLCHHDRDDVELKADRIYYPYFSSGVYRATYIVNNEVKTVEMRSFHENETAEVTINKGNMIVVRIGERYFAIDKPTGTVMEVTDLDICKGNLS